MEGQQRSTARQRYGPGFRLMALVVAAAFFAQVGFAWANVPGRRLPGGAGANPGTQEQELANITMPAPYNTYEFVVTCMACHGGTVDQNAGHGGNWAGTSMASAARDPIFRANEVIVNDQLRALTGEDGAGNVCFRCHSPNGWYSGRFNPQLGGSGNGSQMIQSIVLSTDGEGIMCEFCHRSIGNVQYKKAGLNASSPTWNMLGGISDWPHTGNPYPFPPAVGNPFGDNTMQIADGMTYGGKYPGSVDVTFSDTPLTVNGSDATSQPLAPGDVVATDAASPNYTGQSYGVYPEGWENDAGDPVTGQVAPNPDGSLPTHFEAPIGPPVDGGTGKTDYGLQSISIEHPTFKNDFLTSPEFCGSCHDLTVPLANHGMPEQRTYTEWKYSDYGNELSPSTYRRCQDCHMPTMKHQYSDTVTISLNPDPVLAGYFPYGKNRNKYGGTTFHKLAGSNRDLPDMMSLLYPEVDLEVVGAPTGNDTRVFPGMMSDRSTMWERSKRNTEVMLRAGADKPGTASSEKPAASAELVSDPVYDAGTGDWTVQVKVTNNTGHKVPSGYPDGRRMYLSLKVTDKSNPNTVFYESGHYDADSAYLYNDSTKSGLTMATTNTIESSSNAVMVYERKTGSLISGDTYAVSPSLLNDTIVFDNRIPPAGWEAAPYESAGALMVTPTTMTATMAVDPQPDANRYAGGVNYDVVTYRFKAQGVTEPTALKVQADLYMQTHEREFMEHLRTGDVSSVRPEGPPSKFDPNYPLTPNYLSNNISGFATMTAIGGEPLNDNWGGVAYASWLRTGKGAPYLMTSDVYREGGVPAPATPTAPTVTNPTDPALVNPITGLPVKNPFFLDVAWPAVENAEGYILWVSYGTTDTTASWDKLTVLDATSTPAYTHKALNVNKTYRYAVQAYNSTGLSATSSVGATMTPWDLPLGPASIQLVPPVEGQKVTLSWYDQDDNELGFLVQRQEAPLNADWTTIANVPANPSPTFGGVMWSDTTVVPGHTYNYRVCAWNNSGPSPWTQPVAATTPLVPFAPSNLTTSNLTGLSVDLAWTHDGFNILGNLVQRSNSPTGTFTTIATLGPDARTYTDATLTEGNTYYYVAKTYNATGVSSASNMVTVTAPIMPPPPPSWTVAPSAVGTSVSGSFAVNNPIVTSVALQRATGVGGVFATIQSIPISGPGTYSFVDTSPAQSTTYQYRLLSYSPGRGFGAPSLAYTVITGLNELPAPTGVSVIEAGEVTMKLGWSYAGATITGFYVERATNAAGPWTRVGNVAAAPTVQWVATGLARRTMYYWRIKAYSPTQVSPPSSPVVSARTK